MNNAAYAHLNTPKPVISDLFDMLPREYSAMLKGNALKVYNYYLNKPDEWNFNRIVAQEDLGMGSHAIRTALAQLSHHFLVIQERVRVEGARFGGYKYHRFASTEDGKRWAKKNKRLDRKGNLIPAVTSKGVMVNTPKKKKASKPAETLGISPSVENPTMENPMTNKEISNKESVCVADAVPAPTADTLTEHFHMDSKLDPDQLLFTWAILNELANGYIDYCKAKGKTPNITGFRYRLEHQKSFMERAERQREASERLAEARADRKLAEAMKLEHLNNEWHSDNIRTMADNVTASQSATGYYDHNSAHWAA